MTLSKLFIVKNHLVKFGSHSYCGSQDITYLICHATLQDYVVKGFAVFMEGNSSLSVTTPPDLVTLDIVVVEIFLIFQVASRDHVSKGFCNFVGGSLSY